jgi:hypothetical protein
MCDWLAVKAKTLMWLRVRLEIGFVFFLLMTCDIVTQRNLPKLKHKFKGSDDDWAAVLSHFLLQQPVDGKGGLILGVRLVYTLKDDLCLTFRRDVQGIKVG